MASVFSKIIQGELPGRFVWKDERAVALLTIEPLQPGHTLVVPREEVDHWQRIDPGLAQHLMGVAQQVGRAIEKAFSAPRVGLIIAGIEVHHVHLHVTPIWKLGDLDFKSVDRKARAEDLDAAAEKIRAALRELGCAEVAG
jgi:diadenosine tetraphosphate (Ap4A) HIT family hydrolase